MPPPASITATTPIRSPTRAPSPPPEPEDLPDVAGAATPDPDPDELLGDELERAPVVGVTRGAEVVGTPGTVGRVRCTARGTVRGVSNSDVGKRSASTDTPDPARHDPPPPWISVQLDPLTWMTAAG